MGTVGGGADDYEGRRECRRSGPKRGGAFDGELRGIDAPRCVDPNVPSSKNSANVRRGIESF